MGTTAQPAAAGNNGQPSDTASGSGEGTATPGGKPPEEETQSKTQMAIGTLPEHIKQGLILARQRNIVAAEISGTNWGKGLDLQTRRAIADWSHNVDIDPATELFVLGGNFYKNAQYYMRKMSEALNAGYIDYALLDHVEVDDRLETMARRTDRPEIAKNAREEIDRRTMMRIQHHIPDKAEAAVICRVKLRGVPVEITAAKWCGGGTRQKDPVGDAFPVETAETRSIRRCMRLCAERKKDAPLAKLVEENDDDHIDKDIGGTLRDGLKRAHEDAALARKMALVPPLMGLPHGDPYGAQVTREAERPGEVPIMSAATGPISDAAREEPKGEPKPEPQPEPTRSGVRDVDDFIDDTDLMSDDERREHARLQED